MESPEVRQEKEQRRKAAAEAVEAERKALEARIATERQANEGLSVPIQKRGKLVFVKEAAPPARVRDWMLKDVYHNLRIGYTPEYVAWRTKYPLDQVLAIAEDLKN